MSTPVSRVGHYLRVDRRSRSIMEWPVRLMPVLIDKIGKLHESAVRHLRSLLREHPHRSSPNPNREGRRNIAKWQNRLMISAFR
jgi:hypothetical protein